MAKRRKGGKARVPGERYKCGKRKSAASPLVSATPEQRSRIRFLVGDKAPELATYPLGVLVAHGLIDASEAKIVDSYRIAKKMLYGSYQPTTWDGTGRASASEEAHPVAMVNEAGQAIEQWRMGKSEGSLIWAKGVVTRVDRVLCALRNRKAHDIFHNFVVEERFPRWIGDVTSYPADRMRLIVKMVEGEPRLVLKAKHEPELALIIGIVKDLAMEFGAARKAIRTEGMSAATLDALAAGEGRIDLPLVPPGAVGSHGAAPAGPG